MQACPYDSIYIDPDDGTAAKCHFCAHRTEVGVGAVVRVVCPEHAIIAGDLDATDGRDRRNWWRARPVRVRKPEQGTQPKLYYIDADESAIVPTAARHEAFYVWSRSAMRACTGAERFIRRTVLCCSGMRWPLTTCSTRVRGDGKCRPIAGRSRSAPARWRFRRSPWRWDGCRAIVCAILRSRRLRFCSRPSPPCCWCGTWSIRSGSCAWCFTPQTQIVAGARCVSF